MASELALRVLIGIVPVISVLTIGAALTWAAMTARRRAKKKTPGKAGAVLVVVTAVLGIANSFADLSLKIGGARITTPDEAQQALVAFYRYTKDDCARAWALLHTARRAELARANKDVSDFCRTYATTAEYQNVHVASDKAASESARVYLVNFDVQDIFPTNTVHDYMYRQMKEAVEKRFVNTDAIVDQFAWDLSRGYVIPYNAQTRAAVAGYLSDKTLEFMFGPEAVAETARYLSLQPQKPSGPVRPVWTHYTQRIIMQYEDGWKIRSGLYPPILRAPYSPAAAIPQH
jgi:uncharacterized membrane protein